MIQDFVPEIQTAGELSIIIIDGEITHAVRKIPVKGDFRSQAEIGGAEVFLERDEIIEDAIQIAEDIWKYVNDKVSVVKDGLLYARIDGVVRSDGKFVLMEAEFVEPWLYLNVPQGRRALELLCNRTITA
jgi:glutathione synthase/RimK-type ligase-like ATP-grasp enzyme